MYDGEETEGSIPILDVQVKEGEEGGSKLATSVYRKPTTAHTTVQRWSLALQTAFITEPNGYANGDLPWQMKECMSNEDPLCAPKKWQSRDRKCYVRSFNPYLGRTTFCSTSTCWWWRPPGSKCPSDAKSSSTDCVSKCTWIQKDFPKIICIKSSPKSTQEENIFMSFNRA